MTHTIEQLKFHMSANEQQITKCVTTGALPAPKVKRTHSQNAIAALQEASNAVITTETIRSQNVVLRLQHSTPCRKYFQSVA